MYIYKLASIFATVDEATYQNNISYDGDLVDTLSDTRTTVDFAYDEHHNISQVKIADAVVLSKEITYNADGSTQSVTTYGNGQKIKKYYDKFDRLIKVSDVSSGELVLVQYIYNDTEIDKSTFNISTFTPTVSANSLLRVVVDRFADTTWYTYDQFGQLEKTEKQNLITTQTHDAFNRVESVGISFGGENMSTTYTYASSVDDTLVAEETVWNMPGEISTTYSRDYLQRPTETTVMVGSNGYKQALEYAPRQTKTWVPTGEFIPIIRPESVDTNAVEPQALNGYWRTDNVGTTNYVSAFKEYSMFGTTSTLVRTDAVEYDANGNITKYGDTTYVYDNLNRLVRENNPTIDKTTRWWYDINGNITYVSEYAYTTDAEPSNGTTTAFIYGTSWKDQLVSFNGQSISYDDAGNPTSYMGANLSWTRGRLLSNYTPSGSIYTTTMQYDADGRRCRKTIPTSSQPNIFSYIYNGNNLIRETKSGTSSATKTYLYNSQGIIGFVYNGVTYTYRKNMFGDIVAIYNGSTKVAEYAYDAWGNCTIVSDTNYIGRDNPFRYRSYYWDNDLQLYYLMSRYYDPQMGRFINADSLKYLSPQNLCGLNLYSYCENNPINKIDPLGHASLEGVLTQFFISKFTYDIFKELAWWDLLLNRGRGIWADMNDIGWNIFNEDEEKVIKSNCVSFYKGVPVIRTNWERSGSFGIIFLNGKDSSKNVISQYDIDELRHERGHNTQLMNMGLLNYGLMIGLPSAFEWSNRSYYERPWEITADIYGGVEGRTHSSTDVLRGYAYLYVSSIFGPLGYLFLFAEY